MTFLRIFIVSWRKMFRRGYSLTSQGVVPYHVERGGKAGDITRWTV